MLFTIVFNEYGLTLNTTDVETAFHACDMPQLVDAVVNAETGKVLWGSLSECELTPEQATVEEAIAERRAIEENERKITAKVGGITRVTDFDAERLDEEARNKPIVPWYRPAEAKQQYVDAIIIPMAKEWAILSRADIGDYFRTMEFKSNAVSIFEQKAKRTWCNRPFYDEIRLYHNGILVRFSVNGHELTM